MVIDDKYKNTLIQVLKMAISSGERVIDSYQPDSCRLHSIKTRVARCEEILTNIEKIGEKSNDSNGYTESNTGYCSRCNNCSNADGTGQYLQQILQEVRKNNELLERKELVYKIQ